MDTFLSLAILRNKIPYIINFDTCAWIILYHTYNKTKINDFMNNIKTASFIVHDFNHLHVSLNYDIPLMTVKLLIA